jgi:hypothetical protein
MYLPVEQLNIGSFIFDPFADKYCEITDILSRRIDLPDAPGRSAHPVPAVVIGAGHFGADRPRVNVAVSPFQELMVRVETCRRAVAPTVDLQTAERVLS